MSFLCSQYTVRFLCPRTVINELVWLRKLEGRLVTTSCYWHLRWSSLRSRWSSESTSSAQRRDLSIIFTASLSPSTRCLSSTPRLLLPPSHKIERDRTVSSANTSTLIFLSCNSRRSFVILQYMFQKYWTKYLA